MLKFAYNIVFRTKGGLFCSSMNSILEQKWVKISPEILDKSCCCIPKNSCSNFLVKKGENKENENEAD